MDFLEEPIRDESPDAYEALRRMVDVPFALGEEFSSKWAFLPYIERALTDLVRLDISNVGGFTEAKKVAGWAEANSPLPVVAGGKSMGGRMSAAANLMDLGVQGLVFVGFPLHPPGGLAPRRDGRRGRRRDRSTPDAR